MGTSVCSPALRLRSGNEDVCLYHLSSGEGETAGSLKLSSQPAKPNRQGPRPTERPCLKRRRRWLQRNKSPWVELWPPHMGMFTYKHTHEYTYNLGGKKSFPSRSIQVVVTVKQCASKMKFVYLSLIILF